MAGDHSKSRRRFRDLIAALEILVLPGTWDALSALLIEQAGFQGVYVTGARYWPHYTE
jgi:2-methylisocitrate lyase-like PEP mutase family enzyme